MTRFGLKTEQLAPGVVCVALTGELDLTRAYSFDEEMRALEAMDFQRIVLDLRQVSFIDSAGLARIIAARRRAQRASRHLTIVRGPAAVQKVFALTALDQHFEMVAEPEAVLL